MSSESHAESPDTYPKKPLWAAALAFLLGPFGMTYTSVALSVLYALVAFILIIVSSAFPINTALTGVVLGAIFGVIAYRYSVQPPKLSHRPWLARLDRPGWSKSILCAVAEAVILVEFVLFVRSAVTIRGISMFPTVLPGEHLAINILPPLRGPVIRGMVVRYRLPGDRLSRISRVVGLAGDTIEMKRGLVYINGKPADDSARISRQQRAGCIDSTVSMNNLAQVGGFSAGTRDKTKLVVGLNQMFLVSDNRAVPVEDSRVFGPLSLDGVSGAVQLRKHDSQPFTISDCHPQSIYGP